MTIAQLSKAIKGIAWICVLFSNALSAQITITDSLKELNLNKTNAKINVASPIKSDASRKWIKTQITNLADKETFYLECQSPHWKNILVVCKSNNSETVFPITGADFNFNTRSLVHKNFLFPLPTQKGKYEIYVGLDDPQITEFSIMIRSSKDLIKYSLAEYFLLGFYYGLLILVALYNTMLFLRGKLNLHLYYVAYIMGCMLMSFKEDGLAYHFLWPSAPSFNYILLNCLAKPIFLATFIFYSAAFLQLNKYSTWFTKSMVYVSIIYFLIYAFTRFYLEWQWLAECIFVAVFLSIYVTVLQLTKQGNTFARYFTIGFSVVLASMFVNFSRQMGWISPTIFTVYIYNFSIVAEIIIFSWALAERIRQIQTEKKKHQDDLIVQLQKNDELQQSLIEKLDENRKLQLKVNHELEEKVQKRTHELIEANEKLKSFAQKVDQMNAALDLQNHHLKKEIKEEKNSRVFQKELSFEEFCGIYPNEETCVKVIYDLKWSNGFVCKKCNNDKSSITQDWTRKKCSKCSHIESTTAHTLYHHLKFPLNKAFYITYVEFAGLHFTNEELSQIIDLRKPTVWAFKQKVLQRTLDKKYKKIKSWQKMILD